MGALRPRQRALRGRHPRAHGSGLARVDPRLPPHARARDAAPAGARSRRRLLPAHALPLVRGLPAASGARTGAARAARSGLRELPGRRLRAALPLVVPAHPRSRLQPRLHRGGRSPGRDRRRPDRDRHRGVHRDAEGPRDRAPARRPRAAVRGPQARPRRRAARLHEGHPAQAARVRAAARAGAGARAHDDHAPGARPLAAREPRVPAAAGRDRAPHLAHQRPLRAARADAGRVPPPRHLEGRARRAVPAGGRDDGDAAPRRDEPRRARVRPLPVGAGASQPLARLARPLGARGLGAGAPRGGARQPVGRGRRRRTARRRRSSSRSRSAGGASRRWRGAWTRSTAASGPTGS